MTIVGLCRFISGVLLLLALLTSAITYHPQVHYLGVVLPAASATGAVLFGSMAFYLSGTGAKQEIFRSSLLKEVFFAVAVLLSLLLIIFAGG